MSKPVSFAVASAACVLMLVLSTVVFAQEKDDATRVAPKSKESLEVANAGPSIQLKTTSVTGSRELPKVLVIVPWKSSEAIGPGDRPLASLVEEALTPVDPDVFRRQLSYYTKLKDAAAKTGSGEE